VFCCFTTSFDLKESTVIMAVAVKWLVAVKELEVDTLGEDLIKAVKVLIAREEVIEDWPLPLGTIVITEEVVFAKPYTHLKLFKGPFSSISNTGYLLHSY
jgi:hypothetical protein